LGTNLPRQSILMVLTTKQEQNKTQKHKTTNPMTSKLGHLMLTFTTKSFSCYVIARVTIFQLHVHVILSRAFCARVRGRHREAGQTDWPTIETAV